LLFDLLAFDAGMDSVLRDWVFANPKTIKLGYGLANDLKMLRSGTTTSRMWGEGVDCSVTLVVVCGGGGAWRVARGAWRVARGVRRSVP
jgi:hypothetical protein